MVLNQNIRLLIATIPAPHSFPPGICLEEKCPILQKQNKAQGQDFEYLEFFIRPYANIKIDGREIGKNKKYQRIKLEPGTYQFEFSHQYAQTIIKNIKVEKNIKPVYIFLEKSKPSSLQILSDIDADIIINKKYMGTAFESKAKPIKI